MNFVDFYRRFGLRMLGHLMTPVVSKAENFVFPLNSALHALYYDTVQTGPDANYYYFRDIKKQIPVFHVTKYPEGVVGSPRIHLSNVTNELHTFHLQNRRFRYVKDPSVVVRDKTTVGVYNYGFLQTIYRYTRSTFVSYYKWYNTFLSFIDQMVSLPVLETKENFVFIELPKVLPGLSLLTRYGEMEHVNLSLLKIFNSPEHWFFLELWKWMGSETERKKSLFDKLSPEKIKTLNIVILETGRFTLINLGVLDDWRIRDGVDTGKLMPVDLQKRFLRCMMSIEAHRNEPEVITTNGENIDESVVHSDDAAEVESDMSKHDLAKTMLESMDEDLQTLDDIHLRRLQEDIENAESIPREEKQGREYKSHRIDWSTVVRETAHPPIGEHLQEQLNALADDANLTAQEYRALSKQIGNINKLPSPRNSNTTLAKDIVVPPEDLVIKNNYRVPDNEVILDKSMLTSSLFEFHGDFIEKNLPRYVMGSVFHMQHAGVIINSYEVDKVQELMGDYEIHTLRVKPLQGKQTTIHFKIPTMDKNGVFTASGNKYRMRMQRGDLPIRKTAPDTVALTTSYGKSFVRRSDKKVNDYASWLASHIRAVGFDVNNPTITNMQVGSVFDNEHKAPRVFTALAQNFRGFEKDGFVFHFDHKTFSKIYDAKILDFCKAEKLIIIAKNEAGDYLALDMNDTLYRFDIKGDIQPVGLIEDFLKLSIADAPIEFAEIKIFGKVIPVGFILAYYYGFHQLLMKLKASHRKVNAGTRVSIAEDEYAIVFSDETYVFHRDEKLAAMVLMGFNTYSKANKQFSAYTFDQKDVYYRVLESSGVPPRYLNEIDLMIQLFVDPISEDILKAMKEPTTFIGLLIRSAELLVSDQHPYALDMNYMRIKGNERVASAVYAELVKSVRGLKNRPNPTQSSIELRNHAISQAIATDPSVAIVNDINPFEDMKQAEAVTYSGTGGRNYRSMSAQTRAFHESDRNVISDGTKDSGDVGINTYTSADPKLSSQLGLKVSNLDWRKEGVTSIFSSSVLLAPGADRDDTKRNGFVSIQNSHTVACDSYHAPLYMTGYEYIVAHRVSDLFATTAKKKGTVTSLTEFGVIVTYDDGSKESVEIGRRYGASAGLQIPHSLVTSVKLGDKVKPGDVISYNTKFFEYSGIDKSMLILKTGFIARTAFLEVEETNEDSCAISRSVAEKLTTETSLFEDIEISFKQNIREIAKIGTRIEYGEYLLIKESEATSNTGKFDQDTIDTLRRMSDLAYKSGVTGVIERISVFYNGDKEDMSASLRNLANVSDSEINRRNRSVGKSGFNGNVGSSFRSMGDPLLLDTAIIRFHITSKIPAGEGDKVVLANQMKSVIGIVEENGMQDEFGQPYDVTFSGDSCHRRQVNNPMENGTTTTLVIVSNLHAAKLYRELLK